MEPEEQTYVNIQELADYKAARPKETETKPVRTDAVAREETKTWSLLKVAAICLALLCFLLLTTVIGVGVLYDRDFNQLSRDLSNQTAEKDQLLVRYQNLTKKIGTCPDGWRQFGCSCYFLSTTVDRWSSSRLACSKQGADLVIIDSKQEMVFLNKLKAHLKFWMGLSKSSTQSEWVWTDRRSLRTAYWQLGHSSYRPSYGRTQVCAAFNSFSAGVSELTIQSWSTESCTQYLQWVCEKQAEMSPLSW